MDQITQTTLTRRDMLQMVAALLGFFTSEIGFTKAMRYRESPGRFDPCARHAPGDKIWAAHA